MSTTLQKIGEIDHVKLFFDPLRKDDSFLVLEKTNEVKNGFILNEEVVLESNANIKWDEVSTIMAGFSTIGTFKKVKAEIDAKNQ